MKKSKAASASALVSAIQMSCSALSCKDLGIAEHVGGWIATQQRCTLVLRKPRVAPSRSPRRSPTANSGPVSKPRRLRSSSSSSSFARNSITVDHADDVLVAHGVGADDHQNTLHGPCEARSRPRRPKSIDVAPSRKVALLPGFVFVPPDRFQPANGAGRQARRVRSQQRRQGLRKVAAGDALQIKPGQKRLDRLGAPEIRRQDR